METSKVIINDQSTDKDRTVTIWEGEAPPYKPKKSIAITGTLTAPHAFLIGRGDLDQTKIHLLIEKDKGTLTLVIDDMNPETTHKIVGKLTEDSALLAFGVNNDAVKWSNREMVKFLRKMRFYFPDKSQHGALIDSLQKWNISVERIFSDHNNDRTGETKMSLETKVNNITLLNDFVLEIPIYQGYDKVKFRVQIGIDTLQTQAQLYFFSDELVELKDVFREKIINEELSEFEKYSFSKVVIS
jgi:hypothetical protein